MIGETFELMEHNSAKGKKKFFCYLRKNVKALENLPIELELIWNEMNP